MATTKLSRKIGQPARDCSTIPAAPAKPSPDWRVNVDGDLCMAGQAIASPAQLAPDDADYWTACANVKLAAAAPEMLATLYEALDALSSDASDARRQMAIFRMMAAITLAGGSL